MPDSTGPAVPLLMTVGLVETEAGGIECRLQVGKHGKVVALTVQTVGELVTKPARSQGRTAQSWRRHAQ
ncbi:MAG: hypothetical protein LC674_00710 [Actinobacteria bacterium]|nr:hypothetical protein [Actinomycetota bacterium]